MGEGGEQVAVVGGLIPPPLYSGSFASDVGFFFAILPLAGVKVHLLQREPEALTSNGSRPKLNRTWEKPKSPCESFITNDLGLKLLLLIIYCILCDQFSNVEFIYSSTRLFIWD